MPRLRRLSVLLACAAGACALGAPSAGAAPANAGQGVVLTAGGHVVRLVATGHRVTDVHVRSVRGLRRGDVVTVRGGSARVRGHVRRVAFLGRVLRRSGRGAVVRLGDGSTFTFSGAARAGRSARATFAPGQNLLVTLATAASGNVAVKVKLLSPAADVKRGARDQRAGTGEGDDGWAGKDEEWADEADGIVTALAADGSSLTIAPADGGADATYPVADPALLDGIAVGDEVAVWLDGDGTAIDVELLGWSEEPDPGDDEDPGFDDGGADE